MWAHICYRVTVFGLGLLFFKCSKKVPKTGFHFCIGLEVPWSLETCVNCAYTFYMRSCSKENIGQSSVTFFFIKKNIYKNRLECLE